MRANKYLTIFINRFRYVNGDFATTIDTFHLLHHTQLGFSLKTFGTPGEFRNLDPRFKRPMLCL